MTVSDLARKHCTPCDGSTPPLSEAEATNRLAQLQGWSIDNGFVTKTFRFKNYHETMAFVNASAWISHREDHHPDIALGYNQCTVRYMTHVVGGLSDNDFICAAKIDALFEI